MALSAPFGVLLIFFLLALGIHVASALFIVGIGGGFLAFGTAIILDFGNQAWPVLNNFVMTSVPLFVLLGELLLRSGIAGSVYDSLSLWLSPLPGGLLHTNIGVCTLLAATSGSSVATAATVGTTALPTFKAKKYNERIVLGSIAAGGTLGILIPPSINMIIYGSLVDVSIGRLFLGGVVPGLFLALSFMLLIALIAFFKPSIAGSAERKTSFREKLRKLPSFFPTLFIFLIVMGSIYAGWATPTEAAALGVLAVLAVIVLMGRFTLAMLHEAFAATLKTTAMILLIMVAAFYLNYVIALIGIPQTLSGWFVDLKISPEMTIWMIVVFYLILGTFIETIAMMVTTIPLIAPLVFSAGYDPVWFGVFLMILCEASLITPPIGMNLYVVQGVRPDGGPIRDVIIGAFPFLIIMLLMVGILIYFPEIVLWLPNRMMG